MLLAFTVLLDLKEGLPDVCRSRSTAALERAVDEAREFNPVSVLRLYWKAIVDIYSPTEPSVFRKQLSDGKARNDRIAVDSSARPPPVIHTATRFCGFTSRANRAFSNLLEN